MATRVPTTMIRPIDPQSDAEIALVAARMRETLIEVLGEERGIALYPLDWLNARVRFHLDPGASTAAVFVSVTVDGDISGHTIVRIEQDESGRAFGLFSTTFVDPRFRRTGVASALLAHGEDWMRGQFLRESATYTATGNSKLIQHYTKAGYGMAPAGPEMVRLSKSLVD